MKIQPQPPKPKVLHDVTDPASVIREAEFPYGSADAADLTRAARHFLHGLADHDTPHLLVGAMAMLQHIDGRPTRGIDLIIARADLETLPNFRAEERDAWFATGTVGPLRVRLPFSEIPLFGEVLARHVETTMLLDVPIRCATPRGLIMLKLFALPSLCRQGNVSRAAIHETDILLLQTLDHQPPETLLKSLRPHLSASDLNALRDVLADIQRRAGHGTRFTKPGA
jgi:hypothetical protein